MNKEIENGDLTGKMRASIETDLRSTLASIRAWIDPSIEEMISYHVGWADGEQSSGKRIRPLLVLLCCQAAGGNWQQALPAASAVEWIHNFSLIHDDIQDQSAFRRGRSTLWKVWGSPQAINTGDAVFALAHFSIQKLLEQEIPADKVLSVHRILAKTSLSLTSGQHLDIAFEDLNQIDPQAYFKMIRGKTAALLGAACHVGALLSPASQTSISSFKSFGENLGLAFQVIDDLLGVWGVSTETGKSAADDLRARKKTLPIIHGLQNSSIFREMWRSVPATDENIIAMREALVNSGSRAWTNQWAEQFTEDAMDALKAAKPREPAGSSLASLTARLLQRVA